MRNSNVLITSCEKTIYLYDTISLTLAGKLTSHKEEIRAMTMSSDDTYFFSAGKGTPNSNGLMIWDLRKYNK